MAAELLGLEGLLIGMLEQPDEVDRLLNFCTQVSISYGRAFIKTGVEVCVFDSYAAPPLVSPQLYKDLILPHIRKLIGNLKECGAEFVEYVIGGSTGPIAEHLFDTGADIVLSDFVSDVKIFLECAEDSNVLVRRNISPILIEQGPEEELLNQTNSVLKLAANHHGVIVGTGVISYNTSVEKVLMVKKMFLEPYKGARYE